MASFEIQNFIRRTEPFDRLHSEELETMISKLEEVIYKKKDIIYIQHKSAILGLDLIFEGGYKTFFYNEDGHKVFPRDLLKFLPMLQT